MSDIFTPPVIAKVVSGLGGLAGGIAFMAFYRPQNVWDAAIRSGLSTAAAIIGSVPLLMWLDVGINLETILASSAFIGFCAWSVLSILARTLLKLQDSRTTIKLPDFIQKK